MDKVKARIVMSIRADGVLQIWLNGPERILLMKELQAFE
jgi:hypothetical protein